MTEEAKESKFPMTFNRCPSCRCAQTITQLAWAEEAEKGKVVKDTPVAAEHKMIPLMDQKKPPLLTVGLLSLQTDYCAKCGLSYCTKAEVVIGQVGFGKPPGQGGGLSDLMPRGHG